MFSALRLLSIWRKDDATTCTKASLFSGSAYFSNRVPTCFKEKWVEHGGEISIGTIFDRRARYFFATDPLEPWTIKLFAKSVMVIHAGWIAHCVDAAFQVPISEYILDDKFVPGPPYKLANNAPPVYVPLFKLGESTDSDSVSDESGGTPVQASETPSTPTSTLRKRKREQAFFDSPSGSLIYSGFGKDGLPQRPRKQRKLRFDPSFSPDGGTSGRGLDRFQDWDDPLQCGGQFNEKSNQDRVGILQDWGCVTAIESPDTPEKPFACEWLSPTFRDPFTNEDVSKTAYTSSQADADTGMQQEKPSVRTIDFAQLPPHTRRWRFSADATISKNTGMLLSVVKSTDSKTKTPKKISFADHARVCVFTVSPRRPDAKAKGDTDAGPAPHGLDKAFEDVGNVKDKIRMSSDDVEGSNNLVEEAIKDTVTRADSPRISMSDSTRLRGVDQVNSSDTLTLTMEEVEAMRRRLISSAAQNGVDDASRLATLFELGKTLRGMAFRHVW